MPVDPLAESLPIDLHFAFEETCPAALLARVTMAADDALAEAQAGVADDVRKVLDALDIPVGPRDLRLMLTNRAEGALMLRGASSGSITLAGVGLLIAGLAAYVVKTTVGETLQEAWKKSKANERLEAFLVRAFGGRSVVDAYQQSLQGRIEEALRAFGPEVSVDVVVVDGESQRLECRVKVVRPEPPRFTRPQGSPKPLGPSGMFDTGESRRADWGTVQEIGTLGAH